MEKDSEYDAIVLAKAGIDRMKWGDKVDQVGCLLIFFNLSEAKSM